ncbi:hypothetical protein D3C87_2119890 [compost metagenome]
MDVIPLNANLVKGSHGSVNTSSEFHPVLVTDPDLSIGNVQATEVYDLIWKSLHSEK